MVHRALGTFACHEKIYQVCTDQVKCSHDQLLCFLIETSASSAKMRLMQAVLLDVLLFNYYPQLLHVSFMSDSPEDEGC